jgi:hypothetical protein
VAGRTEVAEASVAETSVAETLAAECLLVRRQEMEVVEVVEAAGHPSEIRLHCLPPVVGDRSRRTDHLPAVRPPRWVASC